MQKGDAALYLFDSGGYVLSSSRQLQYSLPRGGDNERFVRPHNIWDVYAQLNAPERPGNAWTTRGERFSGLLHQQAHLHTLALFCAPLKRAGISYVYDEPFAARAGSDARIRSLGSGSSGSAVFVPSFSAEDGAVVKVLRTQFVQQGVWELKINMISKAPNPSWAMRKAAPGGFYGYFQNAQETADRETVDQLKGKVFNAHRLFSEGVVDRAQESAQSEMALAQYAATGTFSIQNVHSLVRVAPLLPASALVKRISPPSGGPGSTNELKMQVVFETLQRSEQACVSFLAGILRTMKGLVSDEQMFMAPAAPSSAIDRNLVIKFQRRVKPVLDAAFTSSNPNYNNDLFLTVRKYVNPQNPAAFDLIRSAYATHDDFTNQNKVMQRFREAFPGDPNDYSGSGRDVLQEAVYLYRCIYVPLCVFESAVMVEHTPDNPRQLPVQVFAQLAHLFKRTGLMTGFVAALFTGTFLVSAVAGGGTLGTPVQAALERSQQQVLLRQKPTDRLMTAQMMAAVHATASAGIQHADISPENVMLTELRRDDGDGRMTVAITCTEGDPANAGMRSTRTVQKIVTVQSRFPVPRLADFGYAKDLATLDRNRNFINTPLGTLQFQSPVYWLTVGDADLNMITNPRVYGVLRSTGMSAVNDYWSMGWILLRALSPERDDGENVESLGEIDQILLSFTRQGERGGGIRAIKQGLNRYAGFIGALRSVESAGKNSGFFSKQSLALLNKRNSNVLIVQWAVIEFNLRRRAGAALVTDENRVYMLNYKARWQINQKFVFGGGSIVKEMNDYFAATARAREEYEELMTYVRNAYISLQTYGRAFADAVFDMFEVNPLVLTRHVKNADPSVNFLNDYGSWVANQCLIPVLESMKPGQRDNLISSVADNFADEEERRQCVPHELPVPPLMDQRLFRVGADTRLKTGDLIQDGRLKYLLPRDDPLAAQRAPFATLDLTGTGQDVRAGGAKRQRVAGLAASARAHCGAGCSFVRSRRAVCARARE